MLEYFKMRRLRKQEQRDEREKDRKMSEFTATHTIKRRYTWNNPQTIKLNSMEYTQNKFEKDFSIIMFQNQKGERKYDLIGDSSYFKHTDLYHEIEIWMRTGILPNDATDVLVERLKA